MIRKKTGLKELTVLLLASAAFVSVACGDDDDDTNPGTAGSAGSGGSSTAGTGTGGKAGSGAGGKAGSDAGGKAGSDAGGKAGSGNGGTAGTGGAPVGGEGGVPPEGGSAGAGEGGEPMGGAPMGGAGGEGGVPEVVFDTLGNVSFEVWNADKTIVQDWTNTSAPAGSSYCEWSTDKNKTGSYRLAHWNNVAYTATTEQTLSPVANGKYTFSIWVSRAAADKLNDNYIFAKDHESGNAVVKGVTDTAVGDAYVKITTAAFDVTTGKVTVGVYTDALAGGWVNFDDAELTPVVAP
jgi:hypothetical protein